MEYSGSSSSDGGGPEGCLIDMDIYVQSKLMRYSISSLRTYKFSNH
ncbi:hypothetical protein [Clostridium frigidicarnis]|nr:hypothetical protein [Clostridium frigidicarnis]